MRRLILLSAGFVIGAGSTYFMDSGTPEVTHGPVSHFTASPSAHSSSQPHWESVKWKQEACRAFADCSKLAEAIVYEARSESVDGQKKVASVILNRLDDRRWPDTLVEVIEQPKQFSYIDDMHLQKTPSEEDWDVALEIAHDLLYGLGKRNTSGTHYHTTKVKPSWSRSLAKLEVVGSHIFYK